MGTRITVYTNIDKMSAFARKYAAKSGTSLHPDRGVTEAVVGGLATHIEQVGRPLCPLFVNEQGLPITEYLPEDHEGRQVYGLVKDPNPDKGRGLGRVLEQQRGAGES